MVRVGDADNPADPLNNSGSVPGIGSVNYEYNIGKYEVTNAQYASFLNATAATDTYGLYSSGMAGSLGGITRSGSSGSYTYTATKPNKPVNWVSFWDAARFTNWLTSGDTETGVYVLLTADNNEETTRDATAWANGGFAIASENEWYKAAYYQPASAGGDSDNYWLYPTRSNSITTADANYDSSNLTDVGSYSDNASYYGTFDQGGNVSEWNDDNYFGNRKLRDGSFSLPEAFYLSSSDSGSSDYSTAESEFVGFRVSRLAAIPEPSTYAAILGGLGLLIVLLHRKGRRTL